MMNEYLDQSFLGNSLQAYLIAAAILLGGLILKKYISQLFSWILYKIFQKYGKEVGVKKFINLLSGPAGMLVLTGIIYLAFRRLSFPDEWEMVSEKVFGVRFVINQLYEAAVIIGISWLLIRVVEFIGLVLMARASYTASTLDDQFIPYFKSAVQIIIGGIGLMTFLGAVFNLNVISILAGLGIGGIALALAAKETLENLLGSFTIFFDKPFKLGDMVRVGENEGRVEHIGFRSTRIRSLDRRLITVPNKKMVDYELINDTDLEVRRARFNISLVYSTTSDQLRKIMTEILDALNAHPLIEPDPLVRFHEFGESSLNILVIYISRTPEPKDFLKVREEVNFSIMEIVRLNNSDFAFPTRTVMLEKESQ